MVARNRGLVCVFFFARDGRDRKKDFVNKKNKEVQAGIKPLSTRPIKSLILVTRRDRIFRDKVNTSGSRMQENFPSKFWSGWVVEENERVDRRTDVTGTRNVFVYKCITGVLSWINAFSNLVVIMNYL